MGAIETKEEDESILNTPHSTDFESHHKMFGIVGDPRSPDIERTPILVQDSRYDPRSPSMAGCDVDRTPVYAVPEPVSPYVKYKMENPAYVDSPLSISHSKHVKIAEDSPLSEKMKRMNIQSDGSECTLGRIENIARQKSAGSRGRKTLHKTVLSKQFEEEFKSNVTYSEVLTESNDLKNRSTKVMTEGKENTLSTLADENISSNAVAVDSCSNVNKENLLL